MYSYIIDILLISPTYNLLRIIMSRYLHSPVGMFILTQNNLLKFRVFYIEKLPFLEYLLYYLFVQLCTKIFFMLNSLKYLPDRESNYIMERKNYRDASRLGKSDNLNIYHTWRAK